MKLCLSHSERRPHNSAHPSGRHMPTLSPWFGSSEREPHEQPAYWASWADSLAMVHRRHRTVAIGYVECLTRGGTTLVGCTVHPVLHGALPPPPPDEIDSGSWRTGRQHEAASRVKRSFRELLMLSMMSDSEKSLLRSQSGPFSGAAIVSHTIKFFSCGLHLICSGPSPPPTTSSSLTARTFRCGHQLDSSDHNRAACALSGLLARRGLLWRTQWRLCREGGAGVTTNVMVRDLDVLVPQALGSRRLGVVAQGLPQFGGTQLAIGATLTGPLHCDGTARLGAAHIDGVAFQAARRRKERTFPELVGPRTQSRFVVLGGEVGGRWSDETSTFVRLLAKAKARVQPSILRTRLEVAWRNRWAAIWRVCSQARCWASVVEAARMVTSRSLLTRTGVAPSLLRGCSSQTEVLQFCD